MQLNFCTYAVQRVTTKTKLFFSGLNGMLQSNHLRPRCRLHLSHFNWPKNGVVWEKIEVVFAATVLFGRAVELSSLCKIDSKIKGGMSSRCFLWRCGFWRKGKKPPEHASGCTVPWWCCPRSRTYRTRSAAFQAC